MNREELQREHPQLVAEIQAEARTAALAEGQALGATAERERIHAVRACALPGHEALVEAMAFDGKTTPAEASMAVIDAHRKVLGKARSAHFADAPAAVAASSADDDVEPSAADAAAAKDAKADKDAKAVKAASKSWLDRRNGRG